MEAFKAALVILLFFLLDLGYVCAADANIAYHIIWDVESAASAASSVTLSDYLGTIYDANNLYLIDVALSPSEAMDDELIASVRGYTTKYNNVRMRGVRRAVPHGVSEVLQLLDGMGELLWWSEEGNTQVIDFYIPLFGGSDFEPVLSPADTRAALATVRGYSFFDTIQIVLGNSVYDRTYFDANLVFSRNQSACLSGLLGPHVRDPEARHRAQSKAALVNTYPDTYFVCSAEYLRQAADSRLSTRLLASMANSYDARNYFFATLARASNTPMVTTSSLRCATHTDPACLFRKRGMVKSGNGNRETISAAIKAHIPRSTVQLDPASARPLPL